jgi:hypothetical protein
MKTLTITDLASTQELDHGAMRSVRGGFKMDSLRYPLGDVSYAPSYDASINAAQTLGQVQNVMLATANGSAFLDGVHVDSDVSQHGENKIIRK